MPLRPEAPIQPDKVVTVLSVSGSDVDQRALGYLFRHTKWTLLQARSCAEAVAVIFSRPVPVVICDCTLPDGFWQDLLAQTRSATPSPVMIVTSRLADDDLWSAVMEAGGFDVLEKPFNQSELVRVVSLAWLQWRDVFHQTRGAAADS